MFNRYVNAIDHLLRPVTKKWCRLTGRTNFAFARLLLWLASGLVLAEMIVELPAHFAFPLWLQLVDILFYLVVIWLLWDRFRTLRATESKVDWSAEVIRIRPAEIAELFHTRHFWTVLSTLLWCWYVLPPYYPFPYTYISATLIAWSTYVALHFEPPGTSVWARAKDRLRNWARRTADALRPMPPPVPIPVRSQLLAGRQ